eukprot:2998178-Amphidinium_carterae.1
MSSRRSNTGAHLAQADPNLAVTKRQWSEAGSSWTKFWFAFEKWLRLSLVVLNIISKAETEERLNERLVAMRSNPQEDFHAKVKSLEVNSDFQRMKGTSQKIYLSQYAKLYRSKLLRSVLLETSEDNTGW